MDAQAPYPHEVARGSLKDLEPATAGTTTVPLKAVGNAHTREGKEVPVGGEQSAHRAGKKPGREVADARAGVGVGAAPELPRKAEAVGRHGAGEDLVRKMEKKAMRQKVKPLLA